MTSSLSVTGERAQTGRENRALALSTFRVADRNQVEILQVVRQTTTVRQRTPSAEYDADACPYRGASDGNRSHQAATRYAAGRSQEADVVRDCGGVVSGVGDDPVDRVTCSAAVEGIGAYNGRYGRCGSPRRRFLISNGHRLLTLVIERTLLTDLFDFAQVRPKVGYLES